MRKPSAFRKTDLTRAALAVHAAGLQIDRVEIAKDGSIIVVPRNKETTPPKNLRQRNNRRSVIPARNMS